mmetsp:Transcript_7587/g.12771  ORF Transcript_7587/g.12771 Transcript_7587/m.12771 type:complete len:359 (+) Transcript_7587:1202-2278(+)
MQISLSRLGEVKVDDHIHRLDVNTSGEQIGRHQVAGSSVTELVENTVAVLLAHFSVDIETAVSKFSNLLGQQFHTINRVTKNNTLVDLQFRKQCVEAVHLLSLLDKGIELRDSSQGELVHQVDNVCIGQEFLFETFHSYRECGRKQQNLTGRKGLGNKGLENRLEFGTQQLVGLVHDEHVALAEVGDALIGQVMNAAGGAHQDVHGRVQTHDVVTQVGASSGHHHLHCHVLTNLLHDGGSLQSQLSSGYQHQHLDTIHSGVNFLEARDNERPGLAGAILGSGQHISAGQNDGNSLFLDRRRLLKSFLKNSHKQFSLQIIVFKFMSFGGGNVSGLNSGIFFRCNAIVAPVFFGSGCVHR